MLIERIRIQRRIHAALKNAKKIDPSIESAQKALKRLERARESLNAFNREHPFFARILRWIDHKLCIRPLNKAVGRVKRLAEKIILPKPSEEVIPLPVKIPEEECSNHVQKLKAPTKFDSAFKWYMEHEGKDSDKADLLERLKGNEESFIRAVKFLKMNYNSQILLNLTQLDEHLILTLPDLFACRLYRDADLTPLILECMERNLSSHAPQELRKKLVKKLGALLEQLMGQNDESSNGISNEIRNIYINYCVESQLEYIPSMFPQDKESLNHEFISIFNRFKSKHRSHFDRDPALKNDFENPPEEFAKEGIPFFIELNHFIQGKRAELVDHIGLSPLIYLNGSFNELWQIVQELKNPDVTDETIDDSYEWIVSYGLLKVPAIRNNPPIRDRLDLLVENHLNNNSDHLERLRSLYREFAIKAGFQFHYKLFGTTADELRISFDKINQSFTETHFELAFVPPKDDELEESIRYLVALNRFLKFRDDPLSVEDRDQLILEALPAILSHHIYTLEGVDQMLLQYFKRQLKISPSPDFLRRCLGEIVKGISDHPLHEAFAELTKN